MQKMAAMYRRTHISQNSKPPSPSTVYIMWTAQLMFDEWTKSMQAIRPHKKKNWWSSPPVPEKRARPDFFLNFYFQKKFSLAFFHILIQSEKYIFDNTFWFVVHLNQSNEGDRLVLLQGLDLPFPPCSGRPRGGLHGCSACVHRLYFGGSSKKLKKQHPLPWFVKSKGRSPIFLLCGQTMIRNAVKCVKNAKSDYFFSEVLLC
jgi:hypothetical protein